MEQMYQYLAFSLVLFATFPSPLSEKCFSRSQNVHYFLATKSPYRYVSNNNDSFVHYPGCHPLRIWLMIRHGTRYPSSKVIRMMRERLPQLRDSILQNHKSKRGMLCNEEIAELQAWSPHVEEADEKRLAHEGEDEMIELAERFQNRFPEILPEIYTNSTFKFRYTATQRTSESARQFAVGLFGRRVSRYVWFPEAIYKDPILRFYKLCHRWRVEVDKNPESLSEKIKFVEGPEMSAALKDVSSRLGFNQTMNTDDALLLYLTCSFETAWDHRARSPWCAAFSETNMKVFEYGEDLEYYWIDGYGYNITYRQACPPIKDMMQYFQNEEVTIGEEDPKAMLYFSHSGTMLKILSHLGLYKDNHVLLHNNFATSSRDRKWRVSQIDCFGTNLAFVLFRCGKQLKVLTLHQEKPITLPGCPESDLCPLNILMEQYRDSYNDCHFDQICGITTHGTKVSKSLAAQETAEVPTFQEERRRTGRYVAVWLIVVACLLGLHHAFVKQNAVLAGLIVPALIMVCYILWVLHTAKKSNHKHLTLQSLEVPTVVVKEATPSPADSRVNIPMHTQDAGVLNNGADIPELDQ